MRSKKSYKMLIIFGLVLFLSVGYAIVNSVSLSITGTSSAGTSTLNVAFTGDKTVSNSTKGSATVTAGSKTATFKTSNMSLNETITFTYKVKNNETDVAANISISTNGSNSYFTITSSSSTQTLQPGDSSTITINVKMIKTPITADDNNASFTVTITGTPTEPSKETNFYINGTKYTATEGMTWEQYLTSPYNTSGFIENAGSVLTIDGIMGSAIMDITLTDQIIDGRNYYTYDD